jgi:hypothetical protein
VANTAVTTETSALREVVLLEEVLVVLQRELQVEQRPALVPQQLVGRLERTEQHPQERHDHERRQHEQADVDPGVTAASGAVTAPGPAAGDGRRGRVRGLLLFPDRGGHLARAHLARSARR